jgi:hypothetical protein
LFKIRTLKDLQISNPLGATVKSTPNDTLNITGTLSFGPVNNTTLHTGNNITLISNLKGTARVADITNNGANNSNNFDGDVIVERYIKSLEHGKSWEFLAIPTKGETVWQTWMENGSKASTGYGTQITGPNGTAGGFDMWSQYPSMKFYKEGSSPNDPNSPDWMGISNTGIQIYNPNGYMLFVRGDRSIPGPFDPPNATRMRTKGKLLTYTVTTALSSTDVYSSVGNPYASSIDMRKVSKTGNAIQSFIVWKSPDYGSFGYGSYITYGLIDGNYYSIPGNQLNNNIESGQAFFIQSNKGGNVVFNEISKTSGFNYTVFRNSSQAKLLRTDLYSVAGNGKASLSDGTLIQFGSEYSNKVDDMDALKMFNGGINLVIKASDKYLVLERRQIPEKQDTIFMNLFSAAPQDYRFVFVAKGLQETGMQPFLEDHYLNTITPLNQEDTTIVNFKVENVKESKAVNRFDIIFKEQVILPVSITSVKGDPKDRNIQVDWNVIHEKNVRQYEIERSVDGVQFIKAGSQTAANKGSNAYSWLDMNVLPGYYYYRIKSIEEKGKVTYSEKVRVLIGNGQPLFTIYPNPITNGIINLQFINQPAGKYVLRLLNNLGQVIVSKQIERNEGSDIQTIQWDYKLAHGTYQLEIFQPDGHLKIIKVLY